MAQGLPSAVTVRLQGTGVGGELVFAAGSFATDSGCANSQEGATGPSHPLPVDSWHVWVLDGPRGGQHLSFVLCSQDGTLRWQQRASDEQIQGPVRRPELWLEDRAAFWTKEAEARRAGLGWGQVRHADGIWVAEMGRNIRRF